MTVIVDAEYVTRAIEDAIATLLLRVVPETGFGVVALPAIIRSTVPPEIAVVAMRSLSTQIERSPSPGVKG